MKNKIQAIISTPKNHLSDTKKKWFAIRTKFKCEKYVSEALAKKGIGNYVPLITKVKRYTSGIKKRQVPLINNYVFVYIVKREYIPVLETDYVLGFIKQGRELISIPAKEIDTLKIVVGEMENVEARDITFSPGDEVEIIGGQLTGLTGILIKEEGKHKFVIQLKTIGVQLLMTVDKSMLGLRKHPK